MIIVRNTKELEQRYNLNAIPDNESVRIVGGLYNKPKYNKEPYKSRVTYTGGQIKQIIAQMKEIENAIPNSWSDLKKAKYIYEILRSEIDYNLNKEEYASEQPSNLTILLSKKGICAGYSLLYKEMMDRQNIPCDYIRGIAKTSRGTSVKHAWNVLLIDGKAIPLDLTWDAGRRKNGENQLKYFGNNTDFLKFHFADTDEKNYNFSYFSQEFVDNIDTTKTKSTQITEEQKINAIKVAIEETYKKFVETKGNVASQKHIQGAIKKYITQGYTQGFTRQGMARQGIVEYVSPNDMIELLIKLYVEQNKLPQRQEKNFLEQAVQSNLDKYSSNIQAEIALKRYIIDGSTNGFTRQNNARANIAKHMTQDKAMELIIQDIVEREIKLSKSANTVEIRNINEMKKIYFNAFEFEQIQLPKQKSKSLIPRAIQWVKEKMRLRREKNQYAKQNEVIENNKEAKDYYER